MSSKTTSDTRPDSIAEPLNGIVMGGNGNSLTQASCTLCRRRKVKCDRSFPCANCQRTGAECEPYTPSRAPRGRQGGRKRKRDDGELLERLTRLEGMVKDIEGQDIATDAAHQKTVAGDGPSTRPSNADAPAATQVEFEGMDKYMASSFWVNLIEEINGLKDVLAVSSGAEDDNDDDRTPVSGSSTSGRPHTASASHSGFVLSRISLSENIPHPTHHQVYTLCEIYLANVDPVFKLLHRPSLRKYLQENGTELESSPGPSGLEALRFAIYYTAVTSMADGECKHRIGEEREVLLTRFRAATETALAKTDFINTVDISTLQALALYLVGVRANDSSRCMWTLTSVAIRIAQAIGLQFDATSASRPPFEREMRRRLWWQICDLDTHAASDRASFPIISVSSFDTRLPLQVNDEDIVPNSSAVVEEREGFTDMTFALSCNEMFDTLRKLNCTSLKEVDEQHTTATWAQWIDTVVQFQRRMEQQYLCRLNLNHPFHWFTRMVIDIIIATLWLLVYRSLQRRPKNIHPSQLADPGILGLAVDVLERAHQLITDPAGSQFKWISQTYVQWHAISVTAAELCVNTHGPMVERAWTIIEPAFAHAARHVADSDTGMLWRPIRKLMKRARKVRQIYLSSRSSPASAFPPVQGQDLSSADDTTVNPNSAGQHSGGSPFSMQGLYQTAPVAPAAPFDWDPWLTAATTTDASSYQDEYTQNLHQMSWTNWQGFIDEVQGQDNSRGNAFTMPLSIVHSCVDEDFSGKLTDVDSHLGPSGNGNV